MTPSLHTTRVCRGCGARGARLTQDAHRTVCADAEVVDSSHLSRVWYWPFWQVTRPWLPRAWRGSDEYDRTTVSVYVPILGAVHFATSEAGDAKWKCLDCGRFNGMTEWCCYVCGAGHPDDA